MRRNVSSRCALFRHASAAVLVVCSAGVMVPTSAFGQTETAKRNLSIPAGDPTAALTQFGQQTGLSLVYPAELARGKTTGGISGSLSVADALARILSGTGLTFRFDGSNTLVIERVDSADGEKITGAVRVEGEQGSPYFGGAGVAAGVNGVNGSRDITATEGTGSFTSGALTVGSKVPQALKDVPQSISVLTSERLEEQRITDFTSALAQLPGVTLTQGNSSIETAFFSRGFQITSIQVDGGGALTTLFNGTSAGGGYFPQIDMSVYDHVELLRGADGLFNGYGSPSGSVNLVRKKPLDHAQYTIDAQAGSWDNYRLVADATSPLAFDGKLRGRLVMTWQDNHHFYEVAKDNKELIYGILELDATPTTLLTVGINYTRQDSVPWIGGLPRYQTGADLGLPRSTALIFPWNRWNFRTTEYFGGIEQKIGKDWTFKLNLTDNVQNSIEKYGSNSASVNPGTNQGARLSSVALINYGSKQFSAEAVLSGAFDIFGQRQEVTIGVNRVDSNAGGYQTYPNLINTSSAAAPYYQPYPGGPKFCFTTSTTNPCPAGSIASGGGFPPINIFNFNPYDPIYSEPPNLLPTSRNPINGTIEYVGYMNLRLTAFNRLHLTTGIRWSHFDSRLQQQQLCTMVTGACSGKQLGDVSSETDTFYGSSVISWPPSANLSYDITKALSAYIGYTDIYVDQSLELGTDLNPIRPVTGSNWEVGLKWAPRNARLNLSAALYSIRERGFGTADGVYNDDGTFTASNGKVFPNSGQVDALHYCCFTSDPNQIQISKGVDLEGTGELLPGWQVAASYNYNENKYEGSYYVGLGKPAGTPLVSFAPKSLYKLWMSYDFGKTRKDGLLSGLSVSGGVNGQSSGFKTGTACKQDFLVTLPTSIPGTQACGTKTVNGVTTSGNYIYSFIVPAYAVFSGRIDYRFSKQWSLAVNLDNILDKTYYQSVGGLTGGNWYGAPRSVTVSIRGKW